MTEARLVLRAAGSHLYPGARGTASGPPSDTETPCLVEFADGSVALGTLAAGEGCAVLAAAPHTTARGTRIAAKQWAVAFEDGPSGLRFRILRRAG